MRAPAVCIQAWYAGRMQAVFPSASHSFTQSHLLLPVFDRNKLNALLKDQLADVENIGYIYTSPRTNFCTSVETN